MKIASSGDWHFGKSGGLSQHNEDLQNFIHFMISECKKRGCSNFVHTGDWFDNRAKVDVPTLNIAIAAMEVLSDNFENVYVIKGNHDIFHKHTRDISSLNIFNDYKNVLVVEKTYQINEKVLLASWICSGEEYDELVTFTKKNKNIEYLFGHFEFANFKLNEYYTMEHGQSHREMKHLKLVISGHYHTRQLKDNVIYNGSPFPFDYGNANEFDHGFSILDTETGSVEHIIYDTIKIYSMSGRDFLDLDVECLSHNDSIRVVIDERLSEAEMGRLNEKLESLSVRDTKIVYKIEDISDDSVTQEVDMGKIMTIDGTVVSYLRGMVEVGDSIDREMLIAIYEESMVGEK